MIPVYPEFAGVDLLQRTILHPMFQQLTEGISEFTFANIYLFRKRHHYRVARLSDEQVIIVGTDQGGGFFMLPFGLPEDTLLVELFRNFKTMKCVSASQADVLLQRGCRLSEDRDNFDYLYRRKDLAELSGRKFHKKRNQINGFVNNYFYEGRPLLEEFLPDALQVLDTWRQGRDDPGDYDAAREALERNEELQLCGGIYYVEGQPAAYSLGEELMRDKSFVIHFEKAVGGFKGVWQFVNQAFSSILPEIYDTVNREQDLGDEGLRHAKLSYKPVDFVKKYRAMMF